MAEKIGQARKVAAGIEERLRHAIAHAKNFGERAVLLPMEQAELLQREAASLVAELDPPKPAPKAKR